MAKHGNTEVDLSLVSKTLSPFLKIEVTLTILSLFGKSKEVLNKCFIVANT